MVRSIRRRSALRDKRVWIAGLSTAALLAVLIIWAVRSHRRAEARDALNQYAPFSNPALELAFPQVALDTPEARDLLEGGVRRRMWTLHSLNGPSPSIEVRLTREGYRWFSLVRSRVVAAFKVGNREVTRILTLKEIFPTRQVRYRYRWTRFQSAGDVLGEERPQVGKEYEGEALLHFENDKWNVMHWTTPDYDRVVDRFGLLEPASR
jgi:hypothetical protein